MSPPERPPASPACDPKWAEFKVRGDDRGQLIALESGREIPFPIARIYYVYGTLDGVRRGAHAHRRLQQLVVAVAGACDMVLDNGRNRNTVRLDRPDRGLWLPPLLWHEMENFSPGCILLVLADAPYDESDYLRNYQDFLNHVHSPHR